MDGAALAVVIAAFVAGAFGLAQTIITSRKLGRIEKSGERIEQRTTDIDDKADAVHDQVRTSNGRTLAQVTEDNTHELAQLRGDMMELAIQFARHTSDPHTHELVRRYRQNQRDRMQLGRDTREMTDPENRRAHGRGPEDLHDDWGS